MLSSTGDKTKLSPFWDPIVQFGIQIVELPGQLYKSQISGLHSQNSTVIKSGLGPIFYIAKKFPRMLTLFVLGPHLTV